MLSEKMRRLLAKRGFASLTKIQELAIPVVASGKHTLIIAPTGFGKTEAALLPLLERIGAERGVGILYITPLRALNRDLLERISWWARELGITLGVRHGDTSAKERAAQAKLPPQLLITTPESLQAMLCAPKMCAHLLRVSAVIVDEVHELFCDKRGAQLALGLERLEAKKMAAGLPAFQRVGLSATVGDAAEVSRFLCGARECQIAALPASRALVLRVISPEPTAEDLELAERLFLEPGAVARLRLLDALVRARKTLIFVNTRSIAETLASRLLRLAASIGIHHGSLAREVRVATEQKFKHSELRGLVATSSLELGIDIGDVEGVVQYMSPRQAVRLVQRVGRSGHAVTKTPRGEIIASDADDILEAAAIAKFASVGHLEKARMASGALDVLAHQLAGLALDYGSIGIDAVMAIVSRAGPYATIGRDVVEEVARQLASERLIRFDGGMIEKNASTRAYYYLNLSTIPSERKFRVRNAATNGVVGSLDEGFVASLEAGSLFITKGVPWRVLDIAEEEIVVEPAETFEAAIPDWEGEDIPVSREVAAEASRLRRRLVEEDIGALAREYSTEPAALERVRGMLLGQHPLPDDKTILIECVENICVIHIAMGSLANAALAKALAARLTAWFGSSVRCDSDAYRILLQLPKPTKSSRIREVLLGLGELRAILDAHLPKTTLFRYKLTHVARAFGLIAENARIGARFVDKLSGTPVFKEALREMYTNYLDVETAQQFLRQAREGNIRILALDASELSPLGRLALDRVRGGELVAPIEPSSEILRAFKAGLLAQNQRFLCTYCGRITWWKLADLPPQPTCPHCWSPLLAPIERGDEKIWGKERWKREKEEEKRAGEIARMASLISAYGRRAAWALATYGVGPETAARALAKLIRDDDVFFAELLEAQKRFIRTKRYWKAG
ncbi:MAG: DEAD/DEAH box helicase [Candidatus Micrarchaeia archaeon]